MIMNLSPVADLGKGLGTSFPSSPLFWVKKVALLVTFFGVKSGPKSAKTEQGSCPETEGTLCHRALALFRNRLFRRHF